MSFKQQARTSTVKRMTVKLGILEGAKYSTEDLKGVLSKVTFDLININLSTKKTHLGINGVGYTSIGFVNGYNPETNEFDVVVFNNRVEAIEKLGEVVVVARTFTNKEGKITKIIGLDIEPLV